MFSVKMSEELIRVFQLGDEDDRVHVIILTADPAAPAFCAGADMDEVVNGSALLGRKEDKEHEHRDPGGQVAMAIYNNRKITIAAVNGHASGTGATALQLPFDFRFIWAGAKVTFPFVRLSIVPESTSTYLLSRLIGESNAAYILFSGDGHKPDAPFLAGLYHKILPTRTEILPIAIEFAKNVAYNIGQVSYAYTKGLLHRSGASIEENHLLESRAIKIIGTSKDTVEGAQSFIKRRRPKYTDTLSENASSWYPWWKPLDVKKPKSKL
ncbi:hypothetical protein GYMLUDRAFT_48075 [Collybiopsis luxurians FD-317 M1]|uniref:Unplaced genomic scaffold GYMLUscaffold_61, whole genome shotgun sequence n=1 Tax=Collybiopsis luxurians FD-317 M1 TaxID=944289 RepID=A0A0D0BZ08_9AGAR|nr:hypothetical protein GYMLUDRAFT_48075 [Collybiopsis luxurians FD-317 M1]